ALSIKDRAETFGKKRHPTIKNNVTIYSGASILGGDTVIGENSIIGGNAFITHSIPDCSTAYTELPKLSIKCKKS
ncbi:MAG: serine acetyltransferase, partial [Clostridia bacterium]|nr:serine acetyltransferase [Clostridia bacterium]